MKRSLTWPPLAYFCPALFLFGVLLAPGRASADTYRLGPDNAEVAAGQEIDLSYFYDELAPYGDWVKDARYGWVWYPYGVEEDWRPYMIGHWEYTDDDGWYWVSDEAWGWATDHYGRWFHDPDNGWAWVPDTQWAAAWVVWRDGDGWVGWAALPPSARYDPSVGIEDSEAIENAIDPSEWVFVNEENLCEPTLITYIQRPVHNRVIIHNTINITNYIVVKGRIFNRGINVTDYEGRHHRHVRRLHIEDVRDRQGRARIEGDRLIVFRPHILSPREGHPPRAPKEYVSERAQLKAFRERRAQAHQYSAGNLASPARAATPAPGLNAGQPGNRDGSRTERPALSQPLQAGNLSPARPPVELHSGKKRPTPVRVRGTLNPDGTIARPVPAPAEEEDDRGPRQRDGRIRTPDRTAQPERAGEAPPEARDPRQDHGPLESPASVSGAPTSAGHSDQAQARRPRPESRREAVIPAKARNQAPQDEENGAPVNATRPTRMHGAQKPSSEESPAQPSVERRKAPPERIVPQPEARRERPSPPPAPAPEVKPAPVAESHPAPAPSKEKDKDDDKDKGKKDR